MKNTQYTIPLPSSPPPTKRKELNLLQIKIFHLNAKGFCNQINLILESQVHTW